MIVELKERLGSELERLAQELAARVPVELGTTNGEVDRAHPDDPVAQLQERVRRLGRLVAALPGVEPGTIRHGQAGFGSAVVLQDLDTDETISYTLLAGEVIDVDNGEVSLASPVGQALLGRRTGDEIVVSTPRGQRRFRVLSLTTLPQSLGMHDAAQAVCA